MSWRDGTGGIGEHGNAMKLTSFQIKNYKVIDDTEPVKVDSKNKMIWSSL
jgi:hypothetical protein